MCIRDRLTRKVEEYLTADLPRPQRYVRASRRFDPETLATCDEKQPRLSLKNGELLWRRGNKTHTLKATGKGLYRKNNNTLASIALVYVDDKRHLQGELGNWVHAKDASRCST